MQHAWRSMLAVLVLSAATGTAALAAPNEHASDQGTEHASDKSNGDQQQAPAQHAVKGKKVGHAAPATTGTTASHGKGHAKGTGQAKGKEQNKGTEKHDDD